MTPCNLVDEKQLFGGIYISILSVQVKVRGIRFLHNDCTIYQITRCHILQPATFSKEVTDVPVLTQLQVTQFQAYAVARKTPKFEIISFFKRAEILCGIGQLAKEYCWAMTRVARPSCCVRSGSGVLDFGFLLDCLEYTYVVDNYAQSVPTWLWSFRNVTRATG